MKVTRHGSASAVPRDPVWYCACIHGGRGRSWGHLVLSRLFVTFGNSSTPSRPFRCHFGSNLLRLEHRIRFISMLGAGETLNRCGCQEKQTYVLARTTLRMKSRERGRRGGRVCIMGALRKGRFDVLPRDIARKDI